MHCELVRTTATDGIRLDGAFFAATQVAETANEKLLDAIVCLHGVGSSFYGSSLFENLLPALRSRGAAVLLVNTRGHDTVTASASINGRRWLGSAYEAVDECRHDVAAWTSWLNGRGFARIGLVGHSLGAIKVIYSQAHAPLSSVQTVVALSPPRLSYAAFINGPDRAPFFDAMADAREHVKLQRGESLIKVNVPFPMIISAAGYIEKYGPDERYNILNCVPLLQVPTLVTYGEQELEQGGIAFAGMPAALAATKRSDQLLDVITIPSADHNYTHTHKSLAAAVMGWLER